MRAILHLSIEQFYVSRVAADQPVLVVRKKEVLDANTYAHRRGVLPAMPVQDARAILGGEALYHPWKADEHAARTEEWLKICAEYSGVIEPEEQHCCCIDLTSHPQPLDIGTKLIEELGGRLRLPIRAAMGPSKWLAKLAAAEGDWDGALLDPSDFLRAKSIHTLTAIPPEQRERLAFLGYKSIGAVADLPLEVLSAQFDKEALTIVSAARGLLPDSVKASYPPDTVSDCVLFEDPIEDWQAALNVLKTMAQRIGEKLLQKDCQATEVTAFLLREEGAPRLFERVFTKPLYSPGSVFASLNLLLQPHFSEPIAGIRVHLPKLEKVVRHQRGLDMRTSGKDRSQQVDAALAKLRKVYGEDTVQLAKDRPVPRRVRVLQAWYDSFE